MTSGVFEIRNRTNNRIFIGYGKDLCKIGRWNFNRLWRNKHLNKVLQTEFNQNRGNKFYFKVLVYCEPFEMARYRTFFRGLPGVYNYIPDKMLPEKIARHPRQHLSTSHRMNISFAMLGNKRKPFSPVTIEKMSQAQLRRFERENEKADSTSTVIQETIDQVYKI